MSKPWAYVTFGSERKTNLQQLHMLLWCISEANSEAKFHHSQQVQGYLSWAFARIHVGVAFNLLVLLIIYSSFSSCQAP